MSNVPEKHRHLESLSASEIEIEIQKLRGRRGEDLTYDELEFACSLHAIARRKTAGPPKSKAAKDAPRGLDSFATDFS